MKNLYTLDKYPFTLDSTLSVPDLLHIPPGIFTDALLYTSEPFTFPLQVRRIATQRYADGFTSDWEITDAQDTVILHIYFGTNRKGLSGELNPYEGHATDSKGNYAGCLYGDEDYLKILFNTLPLEIELSQGAVEFLPEVCQSYTSPSDMRIYAEGEPIDRIQLPQYLELEKLSDIWYIKDTAPTVTVPTPLKYLVLYSGLNDEEGIVLGGYSVNIGHADTSDMLVTTSAQGLTIASAARTTQLKEY